MTHKRRDRRPRWLQALDALHRIELLLRQLAQGQFATARRLARIEQALQLSIINDNVNTEAVMAALDTLESDVAAQTDVIDSAVTLLDTLHQELADAIASGDPARVQAVADKLEANTQALAEAVAANTPADNGGTDQPADSGDQGGTDTEPAPVDDGTGTPDEIPGGNPVEPA